MKTVKTNLIVLLMLTLFLLIGCDNPTNPPPTSGTISGTVTFTVPTGETINDIWPDDGTITIATYLSWPPTVPADTTDFTLDKLEGNQYHYTFDDVIFETYQGIAVTWKDPIDDEPSTQYHILGTYGGSYSFVPEYYTLLLQFPMPGTDPTAVTVSSSTIALTGNNFSADLSYVTSCRKITDQTACVGQKNVDDQNYCIWLPAGSMGPSQTTDQCM